MENKALLFLLIITLFSCNSPEQPKINATPEVLEENKLSDIDFSYDSKRFRKSILQKLFDEAIENDSLLKSVFDKAELASDYVEDSLKTYVKYKDNNTAYWSDANRYINMIKDSTLKEKLRSMYVILQNSHQKRVANHDSLLLNIHEKQQRIQDYKYATMLLVTEVMMSNYQRNELPSIKTLESVSNQCDSTLTTLKPFLQIKK